jgi:hypothetical protein
MLRSTDQKYVALGSPRGHGRNEQAVWLSRFKVFVAVDGNINVSCQQGFFDFLGEETFALQFLESLDLLSIALGGKHFDFARSASCFNQIAYVVSLPQSEITTTGANDEMGSVRHSASRLV